MLTKELSQIRLPETSSERDHLSFKSSIKPPACDQLLFMLTVKPTCTGSLAGVMNRVDQSEWSSGTHGKRRRKPKVEDTQIWGNELVAWWKTTSDGSFVAFSHANGWRLPLGAAMGEGRYKRRGQLMLSGCLRTFEVATRITCKVNHPCESQKQR